MNVLKMAWMQLMIPTTKKKLFVMKVSANKIKIKAIIKERLKM